MFLADIGISQCRIINLLPSAYTCLPIRRRDGICPVGDKGLKARTSTTDIQTHEEFVRQMQAGPRAAIGSGPTFVGNILPLSVVEAHPRLCRPLYHFLHVICSERRVSAE